MPTTKSPIIFYDSECGFCNFWVQWILNSHAANLFLFAPLGGTTSKQLLSSPLNRPPHHTIVLLDQDVPHTQSVAVLTILKKLPYPWKLFTIFKVLPSSWLDTLYAFISRNRHRIGLTNYCAIPTLEQQKLFLP
jgi:predicted DCC family thiol-disulfide oxidoreductase YuxK